MGEVRQEFIELEPAFMAIVSQDEMLNDRSKKKASRFLEKFFELLRDDKDFERYVLTKCRK